MGRKNNEDDVRVKMLSYGVRLTCYVSGAEKEHTELKKYLIDKIKLK